MLVSKQFVKGFILGGQCECVIKNPETGNSYQYKIQRPQDNSDLYFVRVKVGHEMQYAGVLSIKGDNVFFNTGKNGIMTKDDQCIKALMYVIKKAENLPDKIEVWHLGRCSRCGRKLEDPDSIAMGMGPHCYKKTMSLIR